MIDEGANPMVNALVIINTSSVKEKPAEYTNHILN